MKAAIRRLPVLIALALHAPTYADEDHAHARSGHLGTVSFPTSCDPRM